nr:MAG TPA: hypothetical protein [Bacteriophage sp.]
MPINKHFEFSLSFFTLLKMPPADVFLYIYIHDLLLFVDFLETKTIKKYKKISFWGRVWGENI